MKNFIQSLLIFICVLISTTGAEEVTVVYSQLGGKVTLQMLLSEGVTINRIYINWYFDTVEGPPLVWRIPSGSLGYSKEAEWATRLSMSDFSLIIGNIQEKDFGTFICKQTQFGKKDIITKYKLFKLTANVSPDSLVMIGESVILACNAETRQDHTIPQIHWLNPQGEQRAANHRGELTVRASRQDNGEWTCVVTGDNRPTHVKVSVIVLDLSPAPSHPLYTSISLPLYIPCSILLYISWDQLKAKGIQGGHWQFLRKPGSPLTPGDSQRLFSLSLEGSPTWNANQERGLQTSDLSKNNLSLRRNQATEADRGEYVCSLEFKDGLGLNRTVHVEVLEILSSPGTELISGQQLNLTCSLGHALTSDLEVKWIPPEQSTLPSLGNAPQSAHLTIPEVGVGHNGKWRCELWQSKTRLTYAVITLQIEAKLSVWLLVTVCGASVIFVLLLVLTVIFIRRLRQRRMRHPRHRFCQCKHPKPKGFYRT